MEAFALLDPEFKPQLTLKPDGPLQYEHLAQLRREVDQRIFRKRGIFYHGGHDTFGQIEPTRPNHRTPAGRKVPVFYFYPRPGGKKITTSAAGGENVILLLASDSELHRRFMPGYQKQLERFRSEGLKAGPGLRLRDSELLKDPRWVVLRLEERIMAHSFGGSSIEDGDRLYEEDLLLEEGIHSDTHAFLAARHGALWNLRGVTEIEAIRAILKEKGSLWATLDAVDPKDAQQQAEIFSAVIEVEAWLQGLSRSPLSLYNLWRIVTYEPKDISPGNRRARERILSMLAQELARRQMSDQEWKVYLLEQALDWDSFTAKVQVAAEAIFQREFLSLEERQAIVPQPWGDIPFDRSQPEDWRRQMKQILAEGFGFTAEELSQRLRDEDLWQLRHSKGTKEEGGTPLQPLVALYAKALKVELKPERLQQLVRRLEPLTAASGAKLPEEVYSALQRLAAAPTWEEFLRRRGEAEGILSSAMASIPEWDKRREGIQRLLGPEEPFFTGEQRQIFYRTALRSAQAFGDSDPAARANWMVRSTRIPSLRGITQWILDLQLRKDLQHLKSKPALPMEMLVRHGVTPEQSKQREIFMKLLREKILTSPLVTAAFSPPPPIGLGPAWWIHSTGREESAVRLTGGAGHEYSHWHLMTRGKEWWHQDEDSPPYADWITTASEILLQEWEKGEPSKELSEEEKSYWKSIISVGPTVSAWLYG